MDKSCGNCKNKGSNDWHCPWCDCQRSSWEHSDELLIESLNDYQSATERTGNHTNINDAMTNYALGIAGESGEIVDLVKKVVYHGHPIDKEKFMAECGDLAWYLARLTALVGVTFEEMANFNIQKLLKRYPMGFDKQKSINRSENDE